MEPACNTIQQPDRTCISMVNDRTPSRRPHQPPISKQAGLERRSKITASRVLSRDWDLTADHPLPNQPHGSRLYDISIWLRMLNMFIHQLVQTGSWPQELCFGHRYPSSDDACLLLVYHHSFIATLFIHCLSVRGKNYVGSM